MPRQKTERFPLTLHHATHQWSKCFTLPSGKRRTVYFGTDRDGALAKYLKEREDWQAGRNPREKTTAPTAITLADLVNAFLARSKQRVATGELSELSFRDYLWTGQQMTAQFGRNRDPEKITPTDFASFKSALAAKYAPSRLSKTITVTRMMFKWGYDSELLERMVRFGPDFKLATKRLARNQKATEGPKLLESKEIRSLLQHADERMKAIVLLAINCGFGNTDVATLPLSAVDLGAGVINFARPKTGIDRRVMLWPETQAALRLVVQKRKPQPEHARLFFVNTRGNPLVTTTQDGKRVDSIIGQFRKLTETAGVARPRLGLYTLRHVFQTVGDEARDPLATAAIMGHADATMGGHYREAISDERLKRVTDHIHNWLFGDAKPATDKR